MNLRNWWRQRAILREYRARHRDGLDWRAAAPSPHPKYDALGVRVGGRLLVVGGYRWLDHVHSHIDLFDLPSGRWLDPIPTPPEMPQSHHAVASDGTRYVWSVSGQRGPQCSPAVRDAFRLDLETRTWSAMPPLPQARYGAAMQYWRGRLHVVGGAREDRWTPATDHWSLAPGESGWREEPPIPVGAMHHASAVAGGRILVFGGQQGDFAPIAGDPEYT